MNSRTLAVGVVSGVLAALTMLIVWWLTKPNPADAPLWALAVIL